MNANLKHLLGEVSRGLGLPDYGSQALTESDLQPPDPEQMAWCQGVAAEYEAMGEVELDALKDTCPLIYQQLIDEAGREDAIRNYVENYCNDGLVGHVRELVRWCHQQIANGERYPDVV